MACYYNQPHWVCRRVKNAQPGTTVQN